MKFRGYPIIRVAKNKGMKMKEMRIFKGTRHVIFSCNLSDKISTDKHFGECLKHEFHINFTCFESQLTKYFGGQNFRRTKFAAASQIFRSFDRPKFCPIRYILFRSK